jgi:hypothetical protein
MTKNNEAVRLAEVARNLRPGAEAAQLKEWADQIGAMEADERGGSFNVCPPWWRLRDLLAGWKPNEADELEVQRWRCCCAVEAWLARLVAHAATNETAEVFAETD